MKRNTALIGLGLLLGLLGSGCGYRSSNPPPIRVSVDKARLQQAAGKAQLAGAKAEIKTGEALQHAGKSLEESGRKLESTAPK